MSIKKNILIVKISDEISYCHIQEFTDENLLSARDKKTRQLSRNRNSNAPLGERGTARWMLGTMFQVGTASSSVPR